MVASSPEAFSTPSPLYQPPHPVDPRPQPEAIDPIQVNCPHPAALIEYVHAHCSVCVGEIIACNMCCCGLPTGLHVLVNRAAPSHLCPAPRLSDASVPAQLQASAQQWHQRQRRTIPVHADGGWSYFMM